MPNSTAPSPSSLSFEEASRRLEAAHRRDEALAHFARRIAHDLGNFVTVTRTYSELLLTDSVPGSPSYADLKEIHRASDMLADYLQRVTRFARVRAMRLRPVCVDDVLRPMVEGEFPSRHAAEVDALLDCGAWVASEEPWLRTAVDELLENAVEASPEEMRVLLLSRRATLDDDTVVGDIPLRAGDYAVIEVRDRGPGFPVLNEGIVGDPFATIKEGVRGAGMGLPLARAVARQGGGEMVVRRIDGETSVELWMPVVIPAE